MLLTKRGLMGAESDIVLSDEISSAPGGCVFERRYNIDAQGLSNDESSTLRDNEHCDRQEKLDDKRVIVASVTNRNAQLCNRYSERCLLRIEQLLLSQTGNFMAFI